MAFFDAPKLENVPAEARRWYDELLRIRGREAPAPSWMSYWRSPKILEARVKAEETLFRMTAGTRFPWEARLMAFMLIAHARRCQGCFGGSRKVLMTLGFDEPTLDGFCANPSELPLSERDRIFVRYVLKIALSPSDLEPKDFRELEAQGFSPEDLQDMIGLAAYAVFNTIFTSAANAALRDD